MNEFKKALGGRIREIRRSLGKNQDEFGEMIGGYKKSAVSSYESGDNSPTPESLAMIAKIGGVTLDHLITGKECQPKTPQPTKADALRLILTSDPVLVEKIKDDLRHQIREETPTYQSGLTSNETRLLKAFALLDVRRQERLIDTAEDMSVALSRGLGSDQGAGDCAGSNNK